jgi:hypothetical protein
MGSPLASSADIYRTVDRPHAYAMIETLAGLDQVSAPPDRLPARPGLDFARHTCIEVADHGKTQQPGPVLMVVAFRVPVSRCAEVDDWYEREHAPLLLEAEGWLRVRRYHGVASQGASIWTHVALHDLRAVTVLDSKERAFARSTAWRARLSQESWFEQAGRWVYERIPAHASL